MRDLLVVEWQKIVRRRLNHVILGVVCALMVLLYVLLWMATGVMEDASGLGEGARVVSRLRSSLFLEETVPFALFMLYAFGFLGGLVMVGANVGSEYTWNTVRTMTAAEPNRLRFLVAKCIALLAAYTVLLLAGLLTAVVVSASITMVDGEFTLDFITWGFIRESVLSFGRLLLATSPYFALALLLGVYGRSATAGIAFSVGVAFLEGIVGGLMRLAGGWVANLPQYMLDTNADNLAGQAGGALTDDIMAAGGSVMGEAFKQPDPVHSAVVLALWAFAFGALAFWIAARQDLEYEG